MHEFTHLDLFSGIGGFALAAQRAGFKTVGFSEVEPYACRVLAERFPGVPNIGDVRKLESFAGLGRVTVITGGYPCQPFSLAGKRAGADDDRHLWPAMRDVIDSVRPAWVIGENVFGHVSMGLDSVLSDLETRGYSAQPFIIPACAVDARHRRDRVWILAHNDRNHSEASGPREIKGGTTDLSISGTEEEIRTNANATRRQKLDASAVANGTGSPPRNDAAQWREWNPEPAVGGVVHGIPARSHESSIVVSRLIGLGNAIVPQVVEPFFHWIRQIETGEINDTTFPP